MKIDFLSTEDIWRAADQFRERTDLVGVNIPPIDVLYVVDVVLRFDLVDLHREEIWPLE